MNHLISYPDYLNEHLASMYREIGYHGTTHDFDAFDLDMSEDGGLHIGTREQALKRNGDILLKIEFSIERPCRAKDDGGSWRAKIKAAKARKCDGIVYLNRHEGIPYDRLHSLTDSGMYLHHIDLLPDAKFKKLLPEAEDSYLLFSTKHVKILEKIYR